MIPFEIVLGTMDKIPSLPTLNHGVAGSKWYAAVRMFGEFVLVIRTLRFSLCYKDALANLFLRSLA